MLTPKSKFGSFDLHYFLSMYIASSPSFLEHLISTYLHYITSVQLDIVFLKQKSLVTFGLLLHKASLLRFLNLNVNLTMDILEHVHQLILDIEERVLSSYFHSIQDFY